MVLSSTKHTSQSNLPLKSIQSRTSRAQPQEISLSAPGKWILAGEHAILRGYQAVALPRTDVHLQFNFSGFLSPTPEFLEPNLNITPDAAATALKRVIQTLQLRFPSLNTAQIHLGQIPQQIQGSMHISGNIPYGAGLGSSAAFCLLTVRWLAHFIDIPESDICTIATALEDEFHGKSSGIDVATIYHATPLSVRIIHNHQTLEKSPQIRKLNLHRLPHFSFHDTGVRALTRACVEKVQALHQTHPALAQTMDQQMDQAAITAEAGLKAFNTATAAEQEKHGLGLLSHAMSLAQDCFHQWGLVPTEAKNLIEQLKQQGALAAKLTGSGGGGTVVALWSSTP